MEKLFKEKLLENFKLEIFLILKIFLAISLLVFGFLFGRIYENANFFSSEKNDNFTYLEIEKISEKGIEGKIKFGSLKILKDGENFSYDSGKFFLEN